MRDKTIPKDFGAMKIFGEKVTPDEFIDKAFELDKMSAADIKLLYKISKSQFSAKLRQKVKAIVDYGCLCTSKEEWKNLLIL